MDGNYIPLVRFSAKTVTSSVWGGLKDILILDCFKWSVTHLLSLLHLEARFRFAHYRSINKTMLNIYSTNIHSFQNEPNEQDMNYLKPCLLVWGWSFRGFGSYSVEVYYLTHDKRNTKGSLPIRCCRTWGTLMYVLLAAALSPPRVQNDDKPPLNEV